jgi:hypothetical protein
MTALPSGDTPPAPCHPKLVHPLSASSALLVPPACGLRSTRGHAFRRGPDARAGTRPAPPGAQYRPSSRPVSPGAGLFAHRAIAVIGRDRRARALQGRGAGAGGGQTRSCCPTPPWREQGCASARAVVGPLRRVPSSCWAAPPVSAAGRWCWGAAALASEASSTATIFGRPPLLRLFLAHAATSSPPASGYWPLGARRPLPRWRGDPVLTLASPHPVGASSGAGRRGRRGPDPSSLRVAPRAARGLFWRCWRMHCGAAVGM